MRTQGILPAALVAISAAVGLACGKAAPQHTQATTSTLSGQAPTTLGEQAPAQAPVKQPRWSDATLYVDGNPTAVMRIYELPPALKTVAVKTSHGVEDRYLFADYLAAIGVDVSKVRAAHFYGSRTVVVDGDQLRTHAKSFGFHYTDSDRGKVVMDFAHGMRLNTSIDILANVAVYVTKEPPQYVRAPSGGYLAFSDGKPVEGIPYAPEEQLKGTRVYVDGKLVSVVKRRLLPNSIVVGELGSNSEFSVCKYLESVGAKTDSVSAVDFLSDDDLVERVSGSDWSEHCKTMTFTIPAKSRGQIATRIPNGNNQRARISAVQVFTRGTPPKRWLAPPEVVALGEDGPKARLDEEL